MEDKWKQQEQKFDEQYLEYLASGGNKTRQEWFSDQAHNFTETFSGMNDMDTTDQDFEMLKKGEDKL